MLTFFLAYLLCGIAIGFIAGLLGIGGGVIGIPALLILFSLQGIPQSVAMHMAIGTSLATVVVTSFASAFAHYRHGMILIPIFKRMIVGAIIGCIIGILIAIHLKSIYLQRIFGLFLLVIAIHILFRKDPLPNAKPRRISYIAAIIFGILSGLLGLGGGMMMVPYFIWCGLPIRESVATAAACILPIALVGSIGYMLVDSGLGANGWLAFSSGLIYWPAFIGISLTSVLTAPLGARVTHSISPSLLKKIFCAVLLIVGSSMILAP